MNILFTILFVAALAGMGCESNDKNRVCFSFDQRQCDGDDWAAIIAGFNNWDERTEALKAYLEGKGVEISEISVQPNYYDAVCEACFVCPEAHRFFITSNEESKETLHSLNLLNLEREECS